MAFGLNRVELIGRLGADVTVKRRPRADAGRQRAMSPALIEALREQ